MKLKDEYEDDPPFAKGSDTSEAAAESKVSTARRDRMRILSYVFRRKRKGATCDECEVRLKMKHQSCSARIWELKKPGGPLIDSGRRRLTRSLRYAAVYVTRDFADE